MINARCAVAARALFVLQLTTVWSQTMAAPDDGAKAAAVMERRAEQERIHHEREVLSAVRQKEEAVCYQRFAVEDCLRGVRAKARDSEDRLRAQEVRLNDAERKEKAAERLNAIEEKQKDVPFVAPSGNKADAIVRKVPADPQSLKTQRDQDAQERAQLQRNKAQAQADEQAARAAANADRVTKARARHAEALKAADERRVRLEKSQADAVAQGRKPVASLPAPAASNPMR